jgi:hypothetical protein
MRIFFVLILTLMLFSGMLLWWQARPAGNVIVPRQDPFVYQSALRGEDWRAFIVPEVISVSPSDTTTDVVLGVEDPIRVRFSSSVKYFFVDFALDPPVELVFENNPEKTEFSLLPQTPLQDGVTYTLTVGYRQRGRDVEAAMDIFHSTFTTLPSLPGTWSTDLQTRLVEAKRFTRPQRISGKYIDINLKSQVMTIFEEGNLVDAFVVSSGLAGMDTPKGEYTIHNKALRPWSKRYLLYMPYWMAITPDGKYGIHELPEWPGGYKEGANHLGRPVSHGCVRLGVGAAKTVYEWASEGTPVIIH